MENKYNEKNILIAKVITGNASQEDIKVFEEWKNSSERNLKYYLNVKKIWDTNQNWLPSEDFKDDFAAINANILSAQAIHRYKQKLLHSFYRAAAVLLLPLTIALGWLYLNPSGSDGQVIYTEISAPKGQISKCILADGSEVWLNSGTTIKYDNQFNKKSRDIFLEGEAYFKVSKNTSKLFRVKTGPIMVQVHGTSFNVTAYPKTNKVETILEEGSVELVLNEKNGKSVYLKPGEQATYNIKKQNIAIDKVDTEVFTVWKQGKVLFRDADLHTIFSELERIYDVSIHLEDPSIGGIRLRGMFEYNHNIVDALYKIESTTNIEYQITGKEVRIRYKR